MLLLVKEAPLNLNCFLNVLQILRGSTPLSTIRVHSDWPWVQGSVLFPSLLVSHSSEHSRYLDVVQHLIGIEKYLLSAVLLELVLLPILESSEKLWALLGVSFARLLLLALFVLPLELVLTIGCIPLILVRTLRLSHFSTVCSLLIESLVKLIVAPFGAKFSKDRHQPSSFYRASSCFTFTLFWISWWDLRLLSSNSCSFWYSYLSNSIHVSGASSQFCTILLRRERSRIRTNLEGLRLDYGRVLNDRPFWGSKHRVLKRRFCWRADHSSAFFTLSKLKVVQLRLCYFIPYWLVRGLVSDAVLLRRPPLSLALNIVLCLLW